MHAILVSFSLLSVPISAQLPQVIPRNDASRCRASARIEVMKVKPRRWGFLEFDCAESGRIEELFLQENGPAAKDFGSFLGAHPRVIDEGPVDLADDGEGALELVLRRLGLPFHSGPVETALVMIPGGRRARSFAPAAFREPAPGFSSEPAISSSQAATVAQETAAKKRSQPSRAVESDLVIEAGRCRDRGRLTLAWRVSLKEAKNPSPLICFIDAATGRACVCQSSTDPR